MSAASWDQQMSMVFHPANLMRQDLFFAANAGHISPKFCSVVQRNKFAALFGAEYNMKEILHVRVEHVLLFLMAGLWRAYGALKY